ncbi:GntR family transcriptional regulator [Naasia lichenicola]|uniref:GntR family transcriptional regulator n=1 Tax=Naasia lichenicola TaxID=2565933 RepID=A0A4S4FTE1_9MICO|nr:GntR family transcriptional regulator [Naasia lichenicola]
MYVQLARAIESFIAREELKPGDLLPSETVLASENRLSRATVIKAFDTLLERGVVTRRQGRGTFVNARPMERQLPELTSFSEHVHGLGLVPGSTLLSFEVLASGDRDRPASAFDAEPLLSDQSLVRIERLRTVGKEPVGIQRAMIPADVAESIGLDEPAAADGGYSLYESLRHNGVYLTSGEESLRAINADEHDASLLGVEEGVALIEVVRNSRDADGRLIEVVRARYLGTKYLYHITFAPTHHGGNLEETTRAGLRSGGGLAAASERMLGRDE